MSVNNPPKNLCFITNIFQSVYKVSDNYYPCIGIIYYLPNNKYIHNRILRGGNIMKKMFKGCLTLIGAIVVIGILIAIFTSGGDESSTNDSGNEKASDSSETTNDEKKEEEVKTVSVGETATVADVGFTVSNVKTTEVIDPGNQFVDPAKASGKFVIMDVKIDNGQKEALTIDSSFFKIKTADGTKYEPSTSTDVTMAMDLDSSFFLTQINPGLSKSGTIVFDVPKDLDLSKAVLYCQTGFFGTESIEITLK